MSSERASHLSRVLQETACKGIGTKKPDPTRLPHIQLYRDCEEYNKDYFTDDFKQLDPSYQLKWMILSSIWQNVLLGNPCLRSPDPERFIRNIIGSEGVDFIRVAHETSNRKYDAKVFGGAFTARQIEEFKAFAIDRIAIGIVAYYG